MRIRYLTSIGHVLSHITNFDPKCYQQCFNKLDWKVWETFVHFSCLHTVVKLWRAQLKFIWKCRAGLSWKHVPSGYRRFHHRATILHHDVRAGNDWCRWGLFPQTWKITAGLCLLVQLLACISSTSVNRRQVDSVHVFLVMINSSLAVKIGCYQRVYRLVIFVHRCGKLLLRALGAFSWLESFLSAFVCM